MAAVKNFGPPNAGTAREIPQPKWERTPWWMFWMPYWRRLDPNAWRTDRYEYRSKRQLAHEFLEKQFSNEKPHTEGGKRRAKF